MIGELRIRGLGVIDEAVVPFAPGLTVLTGETGAGKTMVLSGLGLVMGQKADAGVVRAGAARTDVDGTWSVIPDPTLAGLLDDSGAELEHEDDHSVLILSRSVAAEGRSRAFAGGRPVPATVLTAITERLIAVHGQADQILLREPKRQRELLDRFGAEDVARARVEFDACYEDWRSADRELRDLLARRLEREREADLLRQGIEEIAAVAPVAGEDEQLKAQAAVLAHATDLIAESGVARDLLVGGDSDEPAAADLVGRARKALDRVLALDPSQADLGVRLDEVASALQDVAADLGRYAAGIEVDPELQARVEERRHLLAGLKRHYGPGLADVIDWWAAAEQQVAATDGAQARIDELSDGADARRAAVVAAAAALSTARRHAATDLATLVTQELHDLAMADAELVVEVVSVADPDEFTADGADTVTMLLRPHAGSEPRPLGKGASGGELSRIMLAIEVVLAGATSVPTYVFDEVDAGIGGRVAVEVGRRLARLARTAQVIVVTHLPQVAAFADRHLVVAKGSDGAVTTASIAEVTGKDRVAELVRMLSGLEGSASGAEHAAELLALAEQERS